MYNTNENKVYEHNMDYIYLINVDQETKEILYNLNKQFLSFKKYKQRIPNIIIDNYSKEKINIITETITSMLIDYNDIGKEKVTNFQNLFEGENDDIDKYSIIVIDDFKYFYDKAKEKYSLVRKLPHIVDKNNAILIITSEYSIAKGIIGDFNEHSYNLQEYIHIEKAHYDTNEILDDIIALLKKKNIKLAYTKQNLLKIITKTVESGECCYANATTYIFEKVLKDKILNNKEVADLTCFDKYIKEETKLDNLIGLDNIKKELETLKNYLTFRSTLPDNKGKIYLNMLFMGNPGTGKTTVARLLGSILNNLGYIKENKVIEIVPNDLMANYVGQTKDKTREILNKAKGGILFIDEAYELGNVVYSDGFSSYMKEAITELLKYLEDPNNVVIFAGYPDEMKKIYDSNPGIKSRIYKEIVFDDYTEKELMQIIKLNLKNLHLSLSKKAERIILDIVNEDKKNKNFGNARYCEQLVQKLIINHANRNLKEENYLITEEDIPKSNNNNSKKRLGFVGD